MADNLTPHIVFVCFLHMCNEKVIVVLTLVLTDTIFISFRLFCCKGPRITQIFVLSKANQLNTGLQSASICTMRNCSINNQRIVKYNCYCCRLEQSLDALWKSLAIMCVFGIKKEQIFSSLCPLYNCGRFSPALFFFFVVTGVELKVYE